MIFNSPYIPASNSARLPAQTVAIDDDPTKDIQFYLAQSCVYVCVWGGGDRASKYSLYGLPRIGQSGCCKV